MLSQEIRRNFLKYFKARGHTIVPSSSVVPHDDPTLLFTNAGMNQFKDVFLAKAKRDYTRAVSSQKCIRVGGKHNDLDNVGHTARHLTFFEMLGNFSFGDYFKKEAIDFAWEVSTNIFTFNPEEIWITVFREDDEAFELWKKIVPEARIVRMDEKDNFWAMGDTGPCGPCSELYFDRGPSYGSARSPKEDTEGTRFLEFWNLVFMQFNRDKSGQFSPLPAQSIDTGSGLERVVALKMHVENVFATDILRDLIGSIESVSGKKYEAKAELAPAFHVIADHLRSLSFAIADGAQPSNVERGYILRKLLRRAVRYGKMLELQEPFLAKILPSLIATMGPDYQELVHAKERIAEILTLEEEAFLRTLKRGGNILNTIIEDAEARAQKQITGEEAFKLKDTYGLPLEEILLIAKDTGLQVNLEAYELLENEAKERSRKFKAVRSQEVEENLFKDFAATHEACQFTGYERVMDRGTVTGLVVDGTFVDEIASGQEGIVLLNQTPFYAEKGGQVGDTGVLSLGNELLFQVQECYQPYTGVIAHKGVAKGDLTLNTSVTAQVDETRRQGIANHHTATHLLHWALEKVLGPHIRQAGSLVEEKRLRFDFNHHKPVTKEELRQIEQLINAQVRTGGSVKSYEISYQEAQESPKIKQFFGEKYGSTVRVIDLDFSQELCGGTHTHHLFTLGLFRITKESSIAAGVRRIEAVTGYEAEEWMYHNEEIAEKTAAFLKIPVSKLPDRVKQVLEENKQLEHELKQQKRAGLKALAAQLLSCVEKVGNYQLIAQMVSVDPELLQELMDTLMNALDSGIIVLGISLENRCQLVARVSPEIVRQGIQAVVLIKEIAPLIEGSGGGRPESAAAGGKRADGLATALAKARQWVAAKA